MEKTHLGKVMSTRRTNEVTVETFKPQCTVFDHPASTKKMTGNDKMIREL